jgi:Uma2 family endonuclease
MATAGKLELMTAEQFGRRPDPGYPEELARGRVVAMSVPDRRHGSVCGRADRIFGNFVDEHDLGRVMTNDSGVITERDPDTVRGADVAYYSYARLPKGPLPAGYGPEVPELVVEVCSEGDRWREVLFSADAPPRILTAHEELTLPGILQDFRVRVGRFFE